MCEPPLKEGKGKVSLREGEEEGGREEGRQEGEEGGGGAVEEEAAWSLFGMERITEPVGAKPGEEGREGGMEGGGVWGCSEGGEEGEVEEVEGAGLALDIHSYQREFPQALIC